VLAKSFNFQVNRRAADLPLHVRREGPKHGVSRALQRFEEQLNTSCIAGPNREAPPKVRSPHSLHAVALEPSWHRPWPISNWPD
jgi:hypothetical protein